MNKFVVGFLALVFSCFAVARPYTYPVVPQTTPIPSYVTGVWVPLTYPSGSYGVTLTLVSGKYYVASSWGLPNTCGAALHLLGTFPKSNPNATVAGQLSVFEPTGDPFVFGTSFTLLQPGKPGYPATITLVSYDLITDRLTINISQQSGFNGLLVMQRYIDLEPRIPLGCN